jgi:hypothetical protein
MQLGSFQIRLVEATVRWVEDHKLLSFSIFSFFYFLGACGKASSKLFWFDELFSWYVAKLPSLSDIWNALYKGVDTNPPLQYFLIRASHWVFGTGELATRLPFIIGFWLALFFLFLLITKRCGSLIAYLSVIFLCLSGFYAYAFEARPYALVLACCCVSLFFWESAIEGRFRRLALLGLSLILNIALFSHYYAIFLFIPLMMGEAYRSFRFRRVDWPIWISIAAGAVVLIPLAPIILTVIRRSEFFWAKPTWGVFLKSIDWFFRDPALVCFYGVGCLLGVIKAVDSLTPNKKNQRIGWNVPSHEWIAVMILMMLPIIGYVIAKLVTNAFISRLFIPAAIGIAWGLALLYHRLLQGRLLITALLLASLLGIFIAKQAADAQGLFPKKLNLRVAKSFTWASSIPGNTPIVISDPIVFLQYQYYAPPGLKSRLCCLVNFNAVDQNKSPRVCSIEQLREKFPIPVEDYQSFLSSHNHFYLLYISNKLLIHKLMEDGVQLKVKNVGERKGDILFEALMDDSFSGKARRSSMMRIIP